MKLQIATFKFQAVVGGRTTARRAFSLVEVLLAIFILGIGMIMVASVFPVGANWTRQAAETSIGQNVAQTALTVIQRHYGVNGDLRLLLMPGNSNILLKRYDAPPAAPFVITPFTLQPFPGFLNIPVYERAYQFGSANPFPATNVPACTYFWSALIRLSPVHRNPQGTPGPTDPTNGILPSSSYSYDVYILVFRKGSAQNTFSQFPANAPTASYAEPLGLRNFDGFSSIGFPETLIPSVGYAAYSAGNHNSARTPSVFDTAPAMGGYGIGAQSGTVFHQVLDPNTNFGSPGTGGAIARPQIIGPPYSATFEPVIYCPAADGADSSASPLIYIFQTTLTF